MVQCIFREWESRELEFSAHFGMDSMCNPGQTYNSFAPNILYLRLVGTFIGTFLPSVRKVIRRKVGTCFRYSELFERKTLLKARTSHQLSFIHTH